MTVQLPAILFDDVELWACDYLRDALAARPEDYTDDVFVSNSIPLDAATGEPKRRDRMVIVRRDGGVGSGVVFDNPRLGIQCWALTTQDAVDIARMVLALLVAAPGDANVKAMTGFTGPTRLADPSKQPLAYVTAELRTKGVDL
jgi:hypothetical protein